MPNADRQTDSESLEDKSAIAILLSHDRRLNLMAMDGCIRTGVCIALPAGHNGSARVANTAGHDTDDPRLFSCFGVCWKARDLFPASVARRSASADTGT